MYSFFDKNIKINDLIVEYEEELHALGHEFIHFLVHHSIDLMFSDRWAGERFIDEAYTELLTRYIFGSKTIYYGPIPDLLDFFNKVTEESVNFKILLSHQLPTMIRNNHYPMSFRIYGDNCLDKFENGEYENGEYQNDEDYLNIQRSIILERLNLTINDFNDLKHILNLLANRPALDEEWIKNYITIKAQNMLDTLDNEDKCLIYRYIDLYNDLNRYNKKDVFEFCLGNKIIAYDGNFLYNMTEDINYYFTYKESKQILKFNDEKGNSYVLDFQNIDLSKRKRIIYEELEQIEELFLKKNLI